MLSFMPESGDTKIKSSTPILVKPTVLVEQIVYNLHVMLSPKQ